MYLYPWRFVGGIFYGIKKCLTQCLKMAILTTSVKKGGIYYEK